MNVFLTGANGMLGSAIARELLNQGHQVKCLIQPGRENQNLDGLAVDLVYGDITNSDFILKETQGCDAIINTAASTQVYPRRNPIIHKVNYEGALNLAEAALFHKMKRMVQIGTANSFKEGPLTAPGDENGEYTWKKFGMDYMDSKFQAQKTLLNWHKERGLPVIIINPGYMIGPFDAGPTSGRMVIACVQNNIPGYTAGGKCFVYSGDVACATVNALSMGTPGECYIAGNENLSYKQFFEKVKHTVGETMNLKKMPGILVLLFGFFSSIFARISGKAPKISYGMARIALVDQYYTNEKIKRELKMPTTPMETAIKNAVDWFKTHGYL